MGMHAWQRKQGAELVLIIRNMAGAPRTREAVVPAVVEKCLGSTRAGTKKAALELLCFYVENEDVMGSEGPVVSHKKRERGKC